MANNTVDLQSERQLKQAAQDGDNTEIERLLDSGVPINTPGHGISYGSQHGDQTPLSEAIKHSKYDTAKLLLKRGALVYSADLFHSAALRGQEVDKQFIREIIGQFDKKNKKIPDIDALIVIGGTNAETLLHRVAEYGDVETAGYLLKMGAAVNRHNQHSYTALFFAAKNNHVEMIDFLIGIGASLSRHDFHGNTAQHIAIMTGKKEAALKLKEKGANIDAKDGYEKNGLLHRLVAVEEKEYKDETLRLAIELGANVGLKDNLGDEPLHIAIEKTNLNAVETLVGLKADVNAKGQGDRTPLWGAVAKNNVDIARFLLENGAEKGVAFQGNTLMHLAAQKGRSEIIQLLFDHGLDVNARNDAGETPLHIAAASGKGNGITLLHTLGAEIDAKCQGGDTEKTYDGATPLHRAAEKGLGSSVRTLAQLGAGINAPRNDGATPLRLAIEKGDVNTIQILANLGASMLPVNAAESDVTSLAQIVPSAEDFLIAAQPPAETIVRALENLPPSQQFAHLAEALKQLEIRSAALVAEMRSRENNGPGGPG
jgi:ankyrin repeat protein